MPPEVVGGLGFLCFAAGVVFGITGKMRFGISLVVAGTALVVGGAFL